MTLAMAFGAPSSCESEATQVQSTLSRRPTVLGNSRVVIRKLENQDEPDEQAEATTDDLASITPT